MKRNSVYTGLAGIFSALASNFSCSLKDNRYMVKQQSVQIDSQNNEGDFYIEEPLQIKDISLEDILKNEVEIIPKEESKFKTSRFVIVYNTNVKGDWCPNCLSQKKEGYLEKITEEFSDSGVGIVVVDWPAPGIGPNKDLIQKLQIEGVPDIKIFKNENGNLCYLIEVENIRNAFSYTKKYLDSALRGTLIQPSPIRIDKDGFREYSVGFSLYFDELDREPYFDLIAILTALARFGTSPNRYFYDASKDEVLVKLNLENPYDFMFARIFDRDINAPRNTNRWVMDRINDIAYKASLKKRKEDKLYAERGDRINVMLNGMWKEEDPTVMTLQEQEMRRNGHSIIHSEFFHFTDQAIPNYIKGAFENFAVSIQMQSLGFGKEYSWIEEFTSSDLKYEITKWAQAKQKSVDIKKLPSKLEIREWGKDVNLPDNEIDNLIMARDKIKKAYRILDEYNVVYGDINIPLPPLKKIIEESEKAVVFRAVSRSYVPETTNRTASQEKIQSEDELLEAFLKKAGESRPSRNVKFFYLSLIKTELGFIYPPFVGGPASITDYIANSDYNNGIFIYEKGRVVERIFPEDVNRLERLQNSLKN